MSFLEDFLGISQRRDLERGRTASRGEITAGRDAARSDYATAEGYFQPFVQTGTQSDKFWADLMGLNGPEARAAAQATYTSDPIFQQMGDRALRGVSRGVAASGQTGAGIQAGANALTGNYTNYLNTLLTRSGQGVQAATGAAGVRSRAGDTEFATGQQLAGIEQTTANARAASRSTGINNLLGVASLGVQAYSGMKYPQRAPARP